MMIINDLFASKKKSKVNSQQLTNIWTGASLSLKNVNLPRYHQRIPEPRFDNDPEELLQIYRMREVQLASILPELHGENPSRKIINESLTVKENVQQIGQDRIFQFLDSYKSWLVSQEPAFEKW